MSQRTDALHRVLVARAGQPVLVADLIQAVWGDEPPSGPVPALRTLVKRLRQTNVEIVTEAGGYRLVLRRGPSELPAVLPDFVGRAAELAELSTSDSPVLAISGPAGVGKTALAIKLAHLVRDRFPDGQLYLRGSERVDQALGRCLRALGVPPQRVPADRAELVDLYRATLTGRRVLVVLDDSDLSPLVPEVEGCTAIVTSRNDLGGVRLGGFTDAEANELLDRLRVEGSPADRAELISRCANLPLALRVAAVDLADRGLADYLADQPPANGGSTSS